VHHEITVVEEHPTPFAKPFGAEGLDPLLLFQRFRDVPRQGLDLPVGTPRAEEKVVGEAGVLPDVEGEDVEPLFLPREAGASKKYVPRGDDRLPSFFLTVQAVVRDVPLDLGRHQPPERSPPANLFPDGTRRNFQDRKNRAKQPAPAGETVGTPGKIIATVPIGFNEDPGGKRRLGRDPRPGEEQEIARREEIAVPVPCGDLRERIGADQEQEVGSRVPFGHFPDREKGVRRAFATKFEVQDGDPLDPCDGGGRHRESILRGGHRTGRLVGGAGRRDQEEGGQREPFHYLRGHPKVAVVERVEGAAEDGDPGTPPFHYCRT